MAESPHTPSNPWTELGEPDYVAPVNAVESAPDADGAERADAEAPGITDATDDDVDVIGVPSATRSDRKRLVQEGASTARWIAETAVLLLLALFIAQGIKIFLVQPYIVPTGSMIPTIEINDRILADKISIWLGKEPQAGDVVVLDDPTGQFDALAKRVVAVGGQTVDFVDGSLYVDGVRQVESYTHGLPSEQQVQPVPYDVPDGEVWVMGDNRTNSADSRTFGSVPVSTIRGIGFWTYWPLDHFGALK